MSRASCCSRPHVIIHVAARKTTRWLHRTSPNSARSLAWAAPLVMTEEHTVEDYLALRKYPALPGRATYALQSSNQQSTYPLMIVHSSPAVYRLYPILSALLPTYGFGAMLILSPVYFSPLQQAEWLVDMDPVEAGYLMAGPSMGMFVGWMVGSVAWTRAADSFGRKPVFLCSAWATVVVAVASTLAWNLASYFVLRTILGVVMAGQAAISYVLTIEWALQRDTCAAALETPPTFKPLPCSTTSFDSEPPSLVPSLGPLCRPATAAP